MSLVRKLKAWTGDNSLESFLCDKIYRTDIAHLAVTCHHVHLRLQAEARYFHQEFKYYNIQHLIDMPSSKTVFFDGGVEAGISLAIREDKIFACFVKGLF